MGGVPGGGWQVVVCLDGTPHAGQPVATRTLQVQLLQLFEELASGDLSFTIRWAVVGHGPGMAHTHQPTHGAEPLAGKVTCIVTVDGFGRAEHRETVADHLAGNRLRRQAPVPCRHRHQVPIVAVHAEDDTVVDLLAVSDGGHGELVNGHTLHGTYGTGVQSALSASDWLGALTAWHT